MEKGNCLIGQSGGPTAVINASLLGIIEEAYKSKQYSIVYGTRNGIEGIINEEIIDFGEYQTDELQLLKTTPSAALGSVRFQMPSDFQMPIYEKVKTIFEKYHITSFFYIGGNDSMDTCNKLSKYFEYIDYKCTVIGIPKTIDNDMVVIDHTPGYASAAKFVATCLQEIYADTQCYVFGRVTLVEIMGRDSGWLTAASKLAALNGGGPDLIYVPENTFDLEKFLNDVKKIYSQKHKVLVAVSEGIKDESGAYFLQKRLYNQNDDFGHLQLGGVGMVLAEIVNKELKLPVRSVELNITQRCASQHLSKTDIEEAYMCGAWGIKFANMGLTGKMVCMERSKNKPYEITYIPVPLDTIANLIKPLPKNWINKEGNDINDEFIDYILPLIQGEIYPEKNNGLPRFFKLK